MAFGLGIDACTVPRILKSSRDKRFCNFHFRGFAPFAFRIVLSFSLLFMPSDTLGRISIPSPVNSGLTFPLISDFGYGRSQDFGVITHHFGELATQAEQRFQVGIGPVKYKFQRQKLSYSDRGSLVDFYQTMQGSYKSFTYNAPNPDKTTTPATVIFDTPPLSVTQLTNGAQAGMTFLEVGDGTSGPTYSVASTCVRFPSDDLATALLDQVQVIIPLVHIRVREAAVPDIYLSDRRCTVGGQLYLPRLIEMGEPGSDVVMSQDIKGTADNVNFSFGNADRSMTALANDTDLKFASIDLCLYHVNSGILLQLWKGFIVNFMMDGTAKFRVQASDGLFSITQQFPSRTLTRTCWKTFDDGINCPYSTQGSGGNPAECSYYFDTPDTNDGCVQHGMTKFFGGHPVAPQAVSVKTGGVAGFFRNTVTSTSIVSDTLWGQALPEIWCNFHGDLGKAFIANAPIIDYRDENDFRRALGIVGAGEIGQFAGMTVVTNSDGYKFIVAPLLDGFPPQGFKVDSQLNITGFQPQLGLREIPGRDPIDPVEDLFAFTAGGSFPPGTNESAAGTAFVEILIAQPADGVIPTLPESHSMTVPIAMGLSGWTWDSAGTRTLTPGLTNPFWIAVNSFLRCAGQFSADSATQLGMFVLPSLNDGAGNGTAEIADLQVVPIVGDPTVLETQFEFQGTLAIQKPFRDWLTEILGTSLGYYTWEFGKLKLGIRENASAVEAFTLGNILFQSLTLQPIEATFEHLITSFADVDYQFQANTADFQDKDHAAYYGRAGSPLTSTMHSVGIPKLSQALRVTATRVREEVGGVEASEWTAARNASWKTTILALGTEAGQVVSMTHPDVPEGFGHFRILKWTLFKDYSIAIDAKTVTPSMYDLDKGPKPADVTPSPLPRLFYPVPIGPEWAPSEIQANSADALWPNEFTFDLAQSYTELADKTQQATLTATGKLPVNTSIPNCPAPIISAGKITQSTTGGFIPGGITLRVSICASIVATDNQSPPSDVILIQIPAGTNTNQFTIEGVSWPANFPGLTGYNVYLSDKDDLICLQGNGALTDTGGGVYTPTSITVLGPFLRSTLSLPDPNITNVKLKSKLLVIPGAIGGIVTYANATTMIATNTLVDAAGTDNWTGRALIAVGRNNASGAFASWKITGFDPTTGTCTLDRSCTIPGHPEWSLEPGDAFVIGTLGYDNSATPLVIADAGLSNTENFPSGVPHTGLIPSSMKGNILRVIAGTNRGAMAKVVDNDATSVTLDVPTVIAADSVWIIEDPTWENIVETTKVANANSQLATEIDLPISNIATGGFLVGGFTIDFNGKESLDPDAPLRMVYLYGSSGARFPYPWATQDSNTPAAPSQENMRNPNFGIRQQVALDVSGHSTPQIIAQGDGIANVFSATTISPKVALSTSTTGGAIPGGIEAIIGVWAIGQDLKSTPMHVQSIIIPAGTNTNTVTAIATFADPAHDAGWVAITTDPNAGWFGPNAEAIPNGSTTYTFTEIGQLNTPVPDEAFDHYLLQLRVAYKLGIGGGPCSSVAAALGGGTVLGFPGWGFDVNALAGRTLSCYFMADFTKPVNIIDVPIIANDGDSITVADDLTGIASVGDGFFIAAKADTFTSTTIGDSLYVHLPGVPGGIGFDATGKLLLIVRGLGAGDPPVPIASNTDTVITTAVPFPTTPDFTSEFIIIGAEVAASVASDPTPVQLPITAIAGSVSLTATVPNAWQHYLVQVRTVDSKGDQSELQYSPFRVMFNPGFADGTVTPAALGDPNFSWEVGFLPGGMPGDLPVAVAGVGATSGLTLPLTVAQTAYAWKAVLEVGPVGADVVMDVLVFRGTDPAISLFNGGAPIDIPDGTGDRVEVAGVITGAIDLAVGDRLQLQVIQIGISVAGQRATVGLYAGPLVSTLQGLQAQ